MGPQRSAKHTPPKANSLLVPFSPLGNIGCIPRHVAGRTFRRPEESSTRVRLRPTARPQHRGPHFRGSRTPCHRSRTHTQIIAVAAADARRDSSVLPRRVGTTARRQTQDNLPYFVFWCLDRWPSRRPSARARRRRSPRASRPRTSRPRRSPASRPSSRGPRPRARRQRQKPLGLYHKASPRRRPPLWNGAGPSCRRPTRASHRVHVPPPATMNHDTRRLALAHVQVPPETLDEVSRALLAAALAARGAVLPTPEKKTQTPSPLQAPAPAPGAVASPVPAPAPAPAARLRPTERANARRRAHEQAAAARRRRW